MYEQKQALTKEVEVVQNNDKQNEQAPQKTNKETIKQEVPKKQPIKKEIKKEEPKKEEIKLEKELILYKKLITSIIRCNQFFCKFINNYIFKS